MASNRVEQLRRDRGMLQDRLAFMAGTSVKTIDAIEAGKFIPSGTLAMRIAGILETPVEQVFTGDNNDVEEKPKIKPVRIIIYALLMIVGAVIALLPIWIAEIFLKELMAAFGLFTCTMGLSLYLSDYSISKTQYVGYDERSERISLLSCRAIFLVMLLSICIIGIMWRLNDWEFIPANSISMLFIFFPLIWLINMAFFSKRI